MKSETSHFNVVRYIPKENIIYLPDHASSFVRNTKGKAKVILDFYWVRNNGKKYKKLIGEL